MGVTYDPLHLPDDPEQLKAIIVSLHQSNTELQTKLDKVVNELQRLTLLFEKFFNKSSQKLLQRLPIYVGFFQFVHNVRRRGNSLLRSLVEALVCVNPVPG